MRRIYCMISCYGICCAKNKFRPALERVFKRTIKSGLLAQLVEPVSYDRMSPVIDSRPVHKKVDLATKKKEKKGCHHRGLNPGQLGCQLSTLPLEASVSLCTKKNYLMKSSEWISESSWFCLSLVQYQTEWSGA